jgi:hypothetical protein
MLFRFGIAGQLISQAAFIFVALALYDLHKGINQRYASLMVILTGSDLPMLPSSFPAEPQTVSTPADSETITNS